MRPLIDVTQVPCQVLDELRVPLKVLSVLNNPEWMAWLLERKGLRASHHLGYDHWHTVRVCALHQA